jgi:acyl-CoA synthetase (AMP-forming)/AMP-acid ligase II
LRSESGTSLGLSARISAGGSPARDAVTLARDYLKSVGVMLKTVAPARIALSGDAQDIVAAVALFLAAQEHQVILVPDQYDERTGSPPFRTRHGLRASGRGQPYREFSGGVPPEGEWHVALYSSGSTGMPRAYGFTISQLAAVAAWYSGIYQVTGSSAIVTCLPVSYNFTFIAGLCLSAQTGARLHLSGSVAEVFRDAAGLASRSDRVVILANPVILSSAVSAGVRLPGNVLIDSGGAPLSMPGISRLRGILGDVREGYGLTETASLTHFDAEGTAQSLGTVGAPMPGVSCWIDPSSGRPRVGVKSPAVGVEILSGGASGPSRSSLLTGDLGAIDGSGRLRLLGRADDWRAGDLWPRDTLDLIGEELGTQCALVRHPAPGEIRIRVLGGLPADAATRVRMLAAEHAGLPVTSVSVTGQDGPLLHSRKMPRVL